MLRTVGGVRNARAVPSSDRGATRHVAQTHCVSLGRRQGAARAGPPPPRPFNDKALLRQRAGRALCLLFSLSDTSLTPRTAPPPPPAAAPARPSSVTVRGRSAHGAQPHVGVDAVVAAVHWVLAMQNVRSRRVDPLEPLVITVGTVHGGDRNNVIAGEVKMTGTVRTFSGEVRERSVALMRDTLRDAAAAQGATAELELRAGSGVTYNEPALVQETLPALRRAAGEQNVLAIKPFMPAEDFSAYQRVVPGFYFFLGAGNRATGVTAGWHTADFDVDEQCLVEGVKVMSSVLLDHLERHAGDAKGERP